MKKSIVTAFLVFICFLLQTSVCHWFSFGGIVPNLLILLTAASGFMNGEKAGMWTGFDAGILRAFISPYRLLQRKVQPAVLSRGFKIPPPDDYGLRPGFQFYLLRRDVLFPRQAGHPVLSVTYYHPGSGLYHRHRICILSAAFADQPSAGAVGKKE